MATNKQIINTRFANKSDTSANWNIASNAAKPFTPLKGEILFYTDLNKIKIGDGEHTPNQLEFISDIDLSKYMLKSTYDANGDGIVDNAEKLGGVAASEYAKKTDVPTVPTNVSAFTNDAGYLTSYTETDPTVPSHVKGITTGDITNWNAKATTNYVDTKVAGIVDTAPEALNTLNELAAALGDDPNFATTVMTEIGKKVDKTTTVNGHALSGDVTVSKSDVGLGNVDNTADKDKSVASATKLATARNINGVAFDGTGDVTVYSPQDFAPLYSSLSTAGWYRIAEIAANNAFSCRLDIGTIYATAAPEVVTLNITKRYGTECNITQINHAGSVSIIPKIRAVQKSGETWYLEMYYDKNTSNAIYCSFTNVTGLKSFGVVLGQHLSTVNFTAGEIPEGYSATEFELSENPIKASNLEASHPTGGESDIKCAYGNGKYVSLWGNNSTGTRGMYDTTIGYVAQVTDAGTTFYGNLNGNATTATAATSATKATQDSNGNVITSTYATKNELNGKAQRISLTGQCQLTDSRLSVIALCYAPTTTSTNNSSYTVGRISVARTNNLDTPKFADIEMGAAHGGIGRVRTRYTRTGFDVFEPCTFEYNGVLYGGVKFNPAVSSFTLVEFTGVTTFPIFALDVYRLDTETVLNEEVYNSLSSSTVIVSHDLYLGDDAFITGANITSQSVASATKATQDASGNTITSTYATKTELTNGLAGKAPSSHTHTKSQITDFPTSMPASDVYSWAKASTKPSYSWSEITSKPSTFTPASHTQAASTITGLATVATSGSYNDLSNKPTIPAAANNGTLTIQKNGTNVATFGANQSTNATANITVPTKTSELTNDSGFKNISYGTTLPSTGVNGQIFLLQG